ncbi:glycine cleavage system protein GcvH [Criblamydia sequanensis]|uniref:Glycine cleavage system H protein n=1 Tax=Candidatus Criblamydia sequanensis CRIB-18 TaxID=1437425 RepID=A0A090DV03_9BACT|nr:glycine cleavage system protein GcvH [Criblamydia sequanensis]CDR32849.1 Glycine cleavage system H protein [Criblamydia sequanensis CRIB-18]
MKYYTITHEWVEAHGRSATIGVSNFAQQELGDIVYVELPEVGKSVQAGSEIAVLESTKAAADVYTPLSGKIIEVNQNLKEKAELINTSPEKEGWLFKIELSNLEELKTLLDAEGYERLISHKKP